MSEKSEAEFVARAIFMTWARLEGSDVVWSELEAYHGKDGYQNATKFYEMALAEARAAIEALDRFRAQGDAL